MKISISLYRWGAWFRINGVGLSIQFGGYRSFSERHGYSPVLRIGPARLRWLNSHKG